jgi:hypothetical protein
VGPSVDVRAALARSYLLDELPPEALDPLVSENLFRHNHSVAPAP